MAVPLIIAHRGDSSARPENTLASCKQALDLGVDVIEIDVQLTSDGHVVVLHDVTVNRTTDGTGSIREMPLAAARKLSAGFSSKFGSNFREEKIPTLGEVLDLVRGRAKLMIEIKRESVVAEDGEGVEARTIAEVQKRRMDKDVMLISFERRALARCQTLAPEMRRAPIFYREEVPAILAAATDLKSDFVMPEKGMLSETLIDAARAAGVKVATWVVDDPAELRALSHFDLYGVGSNCPGVLLDALWSGE
jgi:glycerophosphoryl diester phosphodiesterase